MAISAGGISDELGGSFQCYDHKTIHTGNFQFSQIQYFKLHYLSLSDTEHTTYTFGHPCKPYIQPNQLWPYPRYTMAIRVYPWKPCMIFKFFKKLTRVPCPCIIVLAIVQTVRDPVRLYETVYTTAYEVHFMSELNRVNIIYKSYGIELEQKSVGPYVNPVNVQLIE